MQEHSISDSDALSQKSCKGTNHSPCFHTLSPVHCAQSAGPSHVGHGSHEELPAGVARTPSPGDRPPPRSLWRCVRVILQVPVEKRLHGCTAIK